MADIELHILIKNRRKLQTFLDRLTDREKLPKELQERERSPRERKAMDRFVFSGKGGGSGLFFYGAFLNRTKQRGAYVAETDIVLHDTVDR